LKVLITPVGSAGDNFPYIGLGTELVRRGHDVTVFTSEPFIDFARRCGLASVQLGSTDEYRETTADPDVFHPRRGFAAVMKYVREYQQRLRAALGEHFVPGETIVVAHALDFVSRCLHEARGWPIVTVHLAPIVLRTLHRTPVMSGTTDLSFLPRWAKRILWHVADRWMIDPHAAPIVNELRAEFALPPVRSVFKDWIHSPLRTIGLFPDWYGPPQPDWPPQLRLTGFPLFDAPPGVAAPDAVESFLGAGEPPIVFTPGSANRHARAFFAAAAGACRRLGRRGLLLTSHGEDVPRPLPDGVTHADFAPLSRILERCAAIVHHGGIGTTAAGLAAGVPQLVMPLSHDQPDNAARVLRLGAGERLMPKRFTERNVGEKLAALLASERVRARCRELALRCRQRSGLSDACDLIEAAAHGTCAPPRVKRNSPILG